jgi:hypothetical protein
MAVEIKELIVRAKVGSGRNFSETDILQIVRDEIQKHSGGLSPNQKNILISEIVENVFDQIQRKLDY